jgi:hypothetical protein
MDFVTILFGVAVVVFLIWLSNASKPSTSPRKTSSPATTSP